MLGLGGGAGGEYFRTQYSEPTLSKPGVYTINICLELCVVGVRVSCGGGRMEAEARN